jgi:hypothetical protein
LRSIKARYFSSSDHLLKMGTARTGAPFSNARARIEDGKRLSNAIEDLSNTAQRYNVLFLLLTL